MREFYKPGMKVLDIGSGNNTIDFDTLIKIDRFEYKGVDAISSADSLPFADNSFDLVFSIALLEHVSNPALVANEMYRITKPSGRVFVLTSFIQWEHDYPFHYFNFTVNGLREIFRKFKEINCKPSQYTSLSQIALIIAEVNKLVKDSSAEIFIKKMMEKENEIKQSEYYTRIYPSVQFYGEKT